MEVAAEHKKTDGLQWWREHKSEFPLLAKIARRYLAIPASSAPSERIFSKLGIIWEKRRANLKPETANAIVFLHEFRKEQEED